MKKLLFILFLGLRFANAQTSNLCLQVDCKDTIQLPQDSAALNATITTLDPIKSLLWSQVAGAITTISGAATASGIVRGLKPGLYIFQMTATTTKNSVAQAYDSILVLAAPNKLPTVSFGAAQSIVIPPNSVPLMANVADSDGTIVSYVWSQVSGPNTAVFAPVNASCIASNLVTGVYVFKLTVTDNSGGVASATIQITAAPAPKTIKSITVTYSDGTTTTL